MGFDPTINTFANRLCEQLLPFWQQSPNDVWILCDGIGAMFQPIEDLVSDRDDGLSGYANLLDVSNIPIDWIGYLAQFVGSEPLLSVDDVRQREWIASTPGFARGRKATSIAAAQAYLTGEQRVITRERDGSAWRYTVITLEAETPDPTKVQAALLKDKPGPDILNYQCLNNIDYQWVKDNVPTYQDLMDNYATYQDLADAQFT